MPPKNSQEIADLFTRLRHLVCPECGKTFTTTNGLVKYCNNYCRRRAVRKRSYATRMQRQRKGQHSLREWHEKCERFKNQCFWCGTSLLDFRGFFTGCKDHLIPLAKGGSNDIDNIVPCCGVCNDAKHDMMPSEFAAKISEKSNFTSYSQEQMRIAALQLVERMAKKKSMHLALGLPEQKRRLA